MPSARTNAPTRRLWRADGAGEFAATGNVWLHRAGRATVLVHCRLQIVDCRFRTFACRKVVRRVRLENQGMSTRLPQPAQQMLNEYSALVHAALPDLLEGVYI